MKSRGSWLYYLITWRSPPAPRRLPPKGSGLAVASPTCHSAWWPLTSVGFSSPANLSRLPVPSGTASGACHVPVVAVPPVDKASIIDGRRPPLPRRWGQR
eukprot:scaffold129919_cov32-Prasinocladus_malaysianus.AAC.1